MIATSPLSPGPGGWRPDADLSFGTDDPLARLTRTSTTYPFCGGSFSVNTGGRP